MMFDHFALIFGVSAILYALYEMATGHGKYNVEAVINGTGNYYEKMLDRHFFTLCLVVVALVIMVVFVDDWRLRLVGLSLLLVLFLSEWRVLAWYYIRKNQAEKNALQNGPA